MTEAEKVLAAHWDWLTDDHDTRAVRETAAHARHLEATERPSEPVAAEQS